MKKMSLKEVLVPAFSLFMICLVVTALLAGTNLMTKDVIAQQSLQKEEESRRVVLSSAETFEEAVQGETVYYLGKDASGQEAGYVFTTKAKGYGGDIQVMTGVDMEGTVTGVVILSQNETPGLGANAVQDSFRNQYKQAAPQNGFSVVKGDAGEGEISAMTGATISSNAVTQAVNGAISLYYEIQGGE